MRPTVCKDEGEQVIPGCVVKGAKGTRYAMAPGYAWRIEGLSIQDYPVVEVQDTSKATYTWCTATWPCGPVAFFTGPNGKEYAQPTVELKEKRERGGRRLSKARREAPGVAPEAPAARAEAPEEAPAPTEPRRRRRKVLELLG